MIEPVPVTGLITACGMNAPQRRLTNEEAGELWEQIWALHDTTPWVIGDYYNWLQDTYGEEASQIFTAEQVKDRRRMHTAQTYGSVCRKVPHSSRLEFQTLSFSHFEVVAAVPDEEGRRELLEQAAADDLNVKDFRKLVGPYKPERKKLKAPRVIDVPESQQDKDGDRSVMDSGQGFGSARRDAVDIQRVNETVTLSDLFAVRLKAILDLPNNPALGRDLMREGFNKTSHIHELDAVILKLQTVRSALFKEKSAAVAPVTPSNVASFDNGPVADQGEGVFSPLETPSPASFAASDEMPDIPAFMDRRGRH